MPNISNKLLIAATAIAAVAILTSPEGLALASDCMATISEQFGHVAEIAFSTAESSLLSTASVLSRFPKIPLWLGPAVIFGGLTTAKTIDCVLQLAAKRNKA